MFEHFVDKVKEVPFTFYTDVIDMAKNLQQKIRNYSDASTGKMNPKSVSIAKVHADVIDRMSVEHYNTLVEFATIYPSIDLDKQPHAIIAMLSTIDL